MHVVYINPNATQAMTDSVVAMASKAAPQAKITGLTNTNGPETIQGAEDGDAAIPGVLNLVTHAQDLGADAIVIACFDDTGLIDARRLADCPVLGIGQSAYTMASLIGGDFSVVTSVDAAVPVLSQNIAKTGLLGCAGMSAHQNKLAQLTGVPLIDGVVASAHFATATTRVLTDQRPNKAAFEI